MSGLGFGLSPLPHGGSMPLDVVKSGLIHWWKFADAPDAGVVADIPLQEQQGIWCDGVDDDIILDQRLCDDVSAFDIKMEVHLTTGSSTSGKFVGGYYSVMCTFYVNYGRLIVYFFELAEDGVPSSPDSGAQWMTDAAHIEANTEYTLGFEVNLHDRTCSIFVNGVEVPCTASHTNEPAPEVVWEIDGATYNGDKQLIALMSRFTSAPPSHNIIDEAEGTVYGFKLGRASESGWLYEYTFDDGSGTALTNATNGGTATLYTGDAATCWENGYEYTRGGTDLDTLSLAQGVKFDGVDQYIAFTYLQYGFADSGLTSVDVEVWLEFDGAGQRLLDTGATADGLAGFFLAVQTTSILRLEYCDGSTFRWRYYADFSSEGTPFAAGERHLLRVVADSSAMTATFYLDGTQIVQRDLTDTTGMIDDRAGGSATPAAFDLFDMETWLFGSGRATSEYFSGIASSLRITLNGSIEHHFPLNEGDQGFGYNDQLVSDVLSSTHYGFFVNYAATARQNGAALSEPAPQNLLRRAQRAPHGLWVPEPSASPRSQTSSATYEVDVSTITLGVWARVGQYMTETPDHYYVTFALGNLTAVLIREAFSGDFEWWLLDGGTNPKINACYATAHGNEWVHLWLTVDGTAAASYYALPDDETRTAFESTTVASTLSSGSPSLTLGHSSYGLGNGGLGNLMIYSRVLSQAEMEANHAALRGQHRTIIVGDDL